MSRFASLPTLVVAVTLLSACSLGEGEGQIASAKLNVPGCWNGQFDLVPDFFAAVPFRRSVTFRVQHGGDTEEVSDGAIILVDDVDTIRATIATAPNTEWRVALSPSIVPPGFPIIPDPDPALVHLSLYLHRACHAQNSSLYAVAGTMRFSSLFDADPNETNAAEKLTDATFDDISVGDPRDHLPGDTTIQNVSHIHGFFNFYFQRGQPAQPFP
jgi:hypothetical protein